MMKWRKTMYSSYGLHGLYGLYGPYGLLFLTSIILSMYASYKVRSSYNRYSLIRCKTAMTGAEVARRILDRNGLQHVSIVAGSGTLTDHYNPIKETISLSEGVFAQRSISAISVAAHEVGHAIQKKEAYSFFKIRSALATPAKFAGGLSWIFIIGGMIISQTAMYTHANFLFDIGIILFAVITLFHLVTLPVELDASKRAIVQLEENGIIFSDEKGAARQVLRGAALTYVAALAASAVQLLRLIAYRNNR